MTDLEAVYQQMLQLSHEQQRELFARLEASLNADAQAKIQALRRAVDAFREGISDDEMREIAAAMNSEYVRTEDAT